MRDRTPRLNPVTEYTFRSPYQIGAVAPSYGSAGAMTTVYATSTHATQQHSSAAAEEPARAFRVGDQVGNWLRVVEPLHRSSRYDTLLVHDMRRDHVCVAKVLRPDVRHPERARARLEREWRLTGTIDHPNIVRACDWSDSPPYLLLQHVPGETLRSVLRREQRFSDIDIRALAQQIGSALRHLHERGFVHADVKPANIMVDGSAGNRTFTLIDFDLVRRVGEPVRGAGTRMFMAPEHAGDASAQTSADAWGLGILLFRAITGELPATERLDQAGIRVRTHAPTRDRDLATMIDHLLAHQPAARPTLADVHRIVTN